MNRKHRQRDYTLDRALTLSYATLKKLNMDLTLQRLGSAGELATYLCLVDNHPMQLTFRGAGSGNSEEAKVKAIYEALEDCLLHQTLSHCDNVNIQMFSTQSSPSHRFLQANELLPNMLQQEKFLNNPYPWLKLKKLHAPEVNIHYPLGLVFSHTRHIPDYNQYVNQADISQIANSTGVAMGATETEALIHGVNDWIERDAYGLFLLKTLMKNAKPARCIIKPTLPPQIQNDIDMIEKTYADDLIIIDITSDVNIPSFFISFTKQAVPVQPSGLGASLCKIDALQQDLFEALQARDRYNSNTVSARQATLQHYEQYPALLRVFQCDLIRLREVGCAVDTDWNDVITHTIDLDLKEQMNVMQHKVNSIGGQIYYNTLFQESNGVSLVYVLLTGVETFGMMREGIFIPIKKRGRETLA